MLILSSRSATVLVIFIVAIVAFCLASVFASMTGPISILPNGTGNGGVLDNVSSFVEEGNTGESYGYKEHNDYSGYSDSSYDSSHDEKTSNDHSDSSNVETTTDSSSSGSSSSHSSRESSSSSSGSGSSSSGSQSSSGSGSSSHVETTVG